MPAFAGAQATTQVGSCHVARDLFSCCRSCCTSAWLALTHAIVSLPATGRDLSASAGSCCEPCSWLSELFDMVYHGQLHVQTVLCAPALASQLFGHSLFLEQMPIICHRDSPGQCLFKWHVRCRGYRSLICQQQVTLDCQ